MNNSLSYQIQKIAKNERCKRDAWDFCLHYDKELFSKRPFLKIIAYTFQYLIEKENTPKHIVKYIEKECKKNNYYYSGQIPKKAGISCPPRSGKSYVISVCSAWALGKYPSESVMRNSCTERLYQKFSYDVRNILKTDKFHEIFETRLKEDKQSLSDWNTDKAKQVSYFGAGVGGTIIGFGCTLIAITDDLYKSLLDALSDNTIDKVKTWKESAHDTRLESGCPELDIGTRWTKKDILGVSEQNKEYDIIIRIPALINGKSFCNDVKTTDEYLTIKKRIPKFLWEAGYMQAPIELSGICFPLDKLKRFKKSELEGKEYHKFNYTDIADEGDCYLCSGFAGILDRKIYLQDVVYTQKNTDYSIPVIGGKMDFYGTQKAIFESNGMGIAYTKLFKEYHKIETNEGKKIDKYNFIVALASKGDKHMRIVIQIDWILKNVYFLDDSEIEDNEEYQLFLVHLSQYLKDKPSKPNDAPDMIAGLSRLIREIIKV